MNEKKVIPPLNKEGCHWGGTISQSKKSNLSITVNVGTDKLQRKLHAIAKHAAALADELDAIDNAWQCDCGASDYTDLHSDNQIVERKCDKCGERYAIQLQA